MLTGMRSGVQNWQDETEITRYLNAILEKKAGDGTGLVYGLGHAIYTESDPRTEVLRKFAGTLAEQKGMAEEFEFLKRVERLGTQLVEKVRGGNRPICANVDFYSGFVYRMLNIPEDLFTPLFAMSRVVGWCAHRLEEVYNPGNKIIRPAYKSVAPVHDFVPLRQR